MTKRPDWDEYFLKIAMMVSLRATCPRANVGAIVVNKEHRILTSGYNGAPPGEAHCDSSGCLLVDNHCQRALHAEMNAVCQAAAEGIAVARTTVYFWDSQGRPPCHKCTQIMQAARISRAIGYDKDGNIVVYPICEK